MVPKTLITFNVITGWFGSNSKRRTAGITIRLEYSSRCCFRVLSDDSLHYLLIKHAHSSKVKTHSNGIGC